MGLVLPVEEAAAQVACSQVLKSYFHSGIARVAAIPPLSHLIKVGAELGLVEVRQAANEYVLPFLFVVPIATVLFRSPAFD